MRSEKKKEFKKLDDNLLDYGEDLTSMIQRLSKEM